MLHFFVFVIEILVEMGVNSSKITAEIVLFFLFCSILLLTPTKEKVNTRIARKIFLYFLLIFISLYVSVWY